MSSGPAPTTGAEPVDPPPPPSAPAPEAPIPTDIDRPTADFSLFNTRSLFRA